jgi:hypothetical protein
LPKNDGSELAGQQESVCNRTIRYAEKSCPGGEKKTEVGKLWENRDPRRIFGIDRERANWHLRPFGAAEIHLPLSEGLSPKPLLMLLA